MDTESKRQALLSAYSTASWRNKVLAMSEDQVVAVYLRLKKSGKV